MNKKIFLFFYQPEKILKNIKNLNKLINILIDEIDILEKEVSTELINKLYNMIPYIEITKEKSKSSIHIFEFISEKEIKLKKFKFFYLLIKYIIIIYLLNQINNNQYDKFMDDIKKNDEYKKIEKKLIETPNEKKLIREEDVTNYGHENIVIKSDITFPRTKYNFSRFSGSYGSSGSSGSSGFSGSFGSSGSSKLIGGSSGSSDLYGSYGSYGSSGSYGYSGSYGSFDSLEDYFDKQEYLKNKEFEPVNDRFKLYRYMYGSSAYTPNNNNGPTFSLSLFMPNTNLYEKNYSGWTKKYYSTQVNNILVLKYYFPNCNIRFYMDWYMLEKGFATLKGDDESLILTKQINNFVYTDFEETKINDVKKYLNDFYNHLKSYENYKYNNAMERFIHTYQMASSVIYSNGTAFINNESSPSIDIFVYKLNKPFVENVGTPNEGHITNGFIGQQIRYISLKQKDYNWNNKINIKRPIHLVWRDCHSNGTAYNDYLWINEMNKLSKKQNTKLYLIPTSIDYMNLWHDIVKSDVDKKYYLRSAIAGIVQFIDSTSSEQIFTNNLYNRSIGITFLLDKNDNLPILDHRHLGAKPNQIKYGYGIDEYINSAFFNMDEIKKNSIYFMHYWSNNIFVPFNTFRIEELILIKYLQEQNLLEKTNEISKYEFLKKIEKLRNDNSLLNNEALKLVLSIYPNKYHSNICIFSNLDGGGNDFYNVKHNINEVIRNLENNDKFIQENTSNITLDKLKNMNITCNSSAISSSIEWNIIPYRNNHSDKDLQSCPSTDYYSGFYNDIKPLENNTLTQPSDLENVYNVRIRNNLKIPLNKTNYKLQTESNNFIDAIKKNIDDNKCHIINALQNIILNYGKNIPELSISEGQSIAQRAAGLNPKGTGVTQSDIWNPLIWKALNYAGYDVKPECFNKIQFNNIKSYEEFNNLVKELSELPGWADYAVNVLTATHDPFKDTDNDFESQIVQDKTKEFTNLKSNDNSMYKMSIYNNNITQANSAKQKYLKYKQKYLNLKNLIK